MAEAAEVEEEEVPAEVWRCFGFLRGFSSIFSLFSCFSGRTTPTCWRSPWLRRSSFCGALGVEEVAAAPVMVVERVSRSRPQPRSPLQPSSPRLASSSEPSRCSVSSVAAVTAEEVEVAVAGEAPALQISAVTAEEKDHYGGEQRYQRGLS